MGERGGAMKSDELKSVSTGAPDRELARHKYVRLAPRFDAGRIRRVTVGPAFGRLRRRAVARLEARLGETVLDVGCGTGNSFPYLLDAVGPDGRVIGIDQSTDMLEQAERRVELQGWGNVSLVHAPAEEASVAGTVDRALIFLAHDLVRNDAALANVANLVRPGGRVVAAGMQRGPRWVAPLSYVSWRAARPYITTFEGRERPWNLLEPKLDGFDVELLLLGLGYVAWGSPPANREAASSA